MYQLRIMQILEERVLEQLIQFASLFKSCHWFLNIMTTLKDKYFSKYLIISLVSQVR